MNFNEASAAYAHYRQQLSAGQINQQQFSAAVQSLRVADDQGNWWQLKEADGSWIVWNGQQWVAGNPPVPQQAPSVPAAAQSQTPRTLVELFQLVLRGLLSLKGLSMIFIVAPLVGFLVMSLHTYFLVVVNEGFNADSSTNPIILRTLAVEGKIISSTVFWGLLSAILTMTIMHIIGRGVPKFVSDLASVPGWLIQSLQQAGTNTTFILILSVGTGLTIGTMLNGYGDAGGLEYSNQLNSLLFAAMMFLALSSKTENLTTLFVTVGWSDMQRWFLSSRQATQANVYWIAVGIAGLIAGLILAVLLGSFYWVSIVLGVAATVAGIFLLFNGTSGKPPQAPMPGGHYMIFFGLTVMLPLILRSTGVLADDGGWSESGGTFSGWVRSEGAGQAVAMGMPPAIAAAAGTAVGTYLGNIQNLISFPPGGYPVPPVQPQVPVTPVAPIPPTAPETPVEDNAVKLEQQRQEEAKARAEAAKAAEQAQKREELKARQEKLLKEQEQAQAEEAAADALVGMAKMANDAKDALKAQVKEVAEDVEDYLEEKRQEKIQELKERQEGLEKAQKDAESSQASADRNFAIVDWTKWGIDRTVDFLGAATGPLGEKIADGYGVLSNTAEGGMEGVLQGKGLMTGLKDGFIKGAEQLLTGKAIGGAFNFLSGKASALTDKIMGNSTVKDIVTSGKARISSVFEGAKSYAGGALDSIKNKITSLAEHTDKLDDYIPSVNSLMPDWLKEKLPTSFMGKVGLSEMAHKGLHDTASKSGEMFRGGVQHFANKGVEAAGDGAINAKVHEDGSYLNQAYTGAKKGVSWMGGKVLSGLKWAWG